MYENYTRLANDKCFELVDQSLYHIWDDIENTPEDTTAEKWKKKILKISREYNYSSRFALIRILYCRSVGSKETDFCCPDEGASFTMKSENGSVMFFDISIQHVLQLTDKELEQYATVLLEVAALQGYPDYDEKTAQRLISKGIQSCKGSISATKLNRKEAFELGHVLGFSAAEMQWFLLRVFHTDDGFMYKSSNDLIEYYCFAMNKNYTVARELKWKYIERTKNIQANESDEYFANWTQKIGESFARKIDVWKTIDSSADELFLQWLTENASFLDQPSGTALRIFRNLAMYAYCIANESDNVLPEKEVCDGLKKVIDKQDSIEIPTELYNEIANTLTLENSLLTFTNVKDKYKADAWGALVINSKGNPSRAKSNLKKVLLGNTPIQKNDALYLIWYLVNRSWTEHVSPEVIDGQWEDILTPDEIFNRLADFTEIADYALDKMLLPAFYPPHLLEQSMMLAIVSSRNNALRAPAETYAAICEELNKKSCIRQTDSETKEKKSKAKKPPTTKEEREKKKIAVVEDYLQDPEQGLRKCANKYGISVQTLLNWKRDYLEGKDN